MPPVAAPAGAPAVTTAPPSSYGAPRRSPDITLIVGGLFTAATTNDAWAVLGVAPAGTVNGGTF